MTGFLVLILGAAVMALWYGASLTHGARSPMRSAVKTCATLLLACAGVVMEAPFLILLGLAFGALGDFFLSLSREKGFLPGLAAFLIGHGLYLALALGTVGTYGQMGAVQVIGAVVLCFCSAALLRKIWSGLGPLRLPVLLYAGLSLALGIAALGLVAAVPLFVLGVLSFIASDMILAVQLFKMDEDDPRYRRASTTLWGLYWSGQFGILVGTLPLLG